MSYSRYGDFGSCITPINYYAVCLDGTVDANFETGMAPWNNDIRSQNCQLLLSQYVAQNSVQGKTFDDISSLAINMKGKYYPNTFTNCDNTGDPATGFIQEQEYGDYIVDNAARMKYCIFERGTPNNFLFNPNDPSSPIITQVLGTNVKPICTVDGKGLDQDILMNKVLEQPSKHLSLLHNIYRNTDPNKLQGTRLGNFYKANNNYFK